MSAILKVILILILAYPFCQLNCAETTLEDVNRWWLADWKSDYHNCESSKTFVDNYSKIKRLQFNSLNTLPDSLKPLASDILRLKSFRLGGVSLKTPCSALYHYYGAGLSGSELVCLIANHAKHSRQSLDDLTALLEFSNFSEHDYVLRACLLLKEENADLNERLRKHTQSYIITPDRFAEDAHLQKALDEAHSAFRNSMNNLIEQFDMKSADRCKLPNILIQKYLELIANKNELSKGDLAILLHFCTRASVTWPSYSEYRFKPPLYPAAKAIIEHKTGPDVIEKIMIGSDVDFDLNTGIMIMCGLLSPQKYYEHLREQIRKTPSTEMGPNGRLVKSLKRFRLTLFLKRLKEMNYIHRFSDKQLFSGEFTLTLREEEEKF